MKSQKNQTISLAVVGLFAVLMASLPAIGQPVDEYPDSARIPVTFYDFHSDGTNPEFEAPYSATQEAYSLNSVHRNMVAATLDTERKPVLGTVPFVNYYIKYWFRPWADAYPNDLTRAQLDNTAPKYTWTYPGNEWWSQSPTYNGIVNAGNDNAFKNAVIQDTLVFWSLKDATGRNTGVYEFKSDAFFPIDNRGFGNEGNTHNFSFTMELHHEFTYKTAMNLAFNFTGDDDVWAFVDNRLQMDLGGIHSPETGSFNVNSVPGLVDNSKYKFDFFYCERHRPGSTILIQTNIIAKPLIGALNINANPPVATIPAGDSVTYTAQVLDDTGADRPDLAALVQWTVEGNPLNPALRTTSGPANTFYGRRAYETYSIIGKIEDPLKPGRFLWDTSIVTVTAGPAYREYIEVDSTPDNWIPEPVASIDIPSSATSAVAYAILRDRYDNLIRKDINAGWMTGSTLVATAAGTAGKLWLGVVSRTGAGSTILIAANTANPAVIPDTVPVNILAWYPLALRFVQPGTNNVITAININTDQNIAIEVQAEKSTEPGVWVAFPSASWALTPATLIADPTIPGAAAQTWTYNPVNPGTGTLTATYSSPGQATPTTPATATVAVTAAPPSSIDIEIITPPAQRKAGTAIQVKLTIKNQDGLVPGQFCSGAIMSDDLGKGGAAMPDPKVIVPRRDATTGAITGYDTIPLGQAIAQLCFNNGLDTVSLLLYYAPITNAEHTIHVVLNSGVNNSTKMVLLPGDLSRLVLEDAAGVPLLDTVTIRHPDGRLVAYARGYDPWNNPVQPAVKSNWTKDGTLHAITAPLDVSRIIYDASSVITSEAGTISATATNTAITDNVFVKVVGPSVGVGAAITRDLDADGYLDAIEIHFGKAVKITAADLARLSLESEAGGLTWINESIVSLSGAPEDSVYILHIREDSTKIGTTVAGVFKPAAQTSWKPYLAINGIDGIAEYPARTLQTIDGAAPVIWQVIKTIKSDIRTEDRVRVIFSEPVGTPEGGGLRTDMKPSDLFNVWVRNPGTQLLDTAGVSGMLDGITQLAQVVNDSTIEFVMTNGLDLSNANFLNIDASPSLIADKSTARNMPTVLNVKKPVEVVNVGKPVLIPIPNPSAPVFTHTAPGVLKMEHEPLATDWVRADVAGVDLEFTVKIPPTGLVRAYIKIYDAVGNIVQQASQPDLLASVNVRSPDSRNKSTWKVKIYWNGSNAQGMPVAPGVYRVIMYLDYESVEASYEDARMITNVGIGR